MSDTLFTVPVQQLFKIILKQEESGGILGIPSQLFYWPANDDPFRFHRYGQLLETPLGAAAGPHTQMAQNIITAWLTGSRYIELKTVQTLDQLNVSKPCIDMEDEGYNCEWSQELRLRQSYDQYLNAWILIHLLRHKFGWDYEEGPGCIFNLSAGYNMEGILKPNVQEFLDKMANCRTEKEHKLAALEPLYPEINTIHIPDRISDSMTLSTMHGCPPEEIEKIGSYLIRERGYHTTIKMNPTLLGPEPLRDILNHRLGFATHVPDEAFAHDLKYEDALDLIASLSDIAQKHHVAFSLKLTNTLESVNHKDVFPVNEKMMYMSGRALHPISVNVAAKLQQSFKGQLELTFSAGVDCFNVSHVIACGIKPVTMCSDLLKPGGYGRQVQYLEQLSTAMKKVDARNLDQFVLHTAKSGGSVKEAALKNLTQYAAQVIEDRRYKKEYFPGSAITTLRPLKPFDCVQAPCQTACPAHQGIPDYMYYTAEGQYQKAFDVIMRTNPFPSVTGMVCDHVCMTACTRINYDHSLRIRDIKRFISRQAQEHSYPVSRQSIQSTGLKVAVIGAGPSGLACAFYLALQGIQCEIFEKKDKSGGMVSATIPGFRLNPEDIQRDIQRIENLGVRIHYNKKIDKALFKSLRQRFDYVYTAVGASKAVRLNIEGETLPGVMDGLEFLGRVRAGEQLSLGKRIAVIGGGNSAADTARTAWRLNSHKHGEITILYRRTKEQMPAAKEEIKELEAEGIKIRELTAPVKISQTKDGLTLTCWKMKLGDRDSSGRPRPVKIDHSDFELSFDTVISAVGQQKVLDFLDHSYTADRETLRLKGKTAVKNLLIGGDALRGPFNIITAIADGKKAADTISGQLGHSPFEHKRRDIPLSTYQQDSARRKYGVIPQERAPQERKNFEIVIAPLTESEARAEASRCLKCDDVCNVCVTVCPNRANNTYTLTPQSFHLQKVVPNGNEFTIQEDRIFCIEQPVQVFNIADFCNECGNCQTFCPTSGAPYRDKPKLCLSMESFRSEPHAFFIDSRGGKPFIRSRRTIEGKTIEETFYRNDSHDGSHFIYETGHCAITLDAETLAIQSVSFNAVPQSEIKLHHAVVMRILLDVQL